MNWLTSREAGEVAMSFYESERVFKKQKFLFDLHLTSKKINRPPRSTPIFAHALCGEISVSSKLKMTSLSTQLDETDSTPALGRQQPSEPPTKQCSLSQGSHETTHPNSSNNHARQSFESQVLTQKELDEKPWKYIGYKGYSSFLASENDFLVFRRFSTASARIALRLQDRVAVLEENLSTCDRELGMKEAEDVHNGSFRQEKDERERILEKMQNGLLECSKFANHVA
jgi:hypothetical protein